MQNYREFFLQQVVDGVVTDADDINENWEKLHAFHFPVEHHGLAKQKNVDFKKSFEDGYDKYYKAYEDEALQKLFLELFSIVKQPMDDEDKRLKLLNQKAGEWRDITKARFDASLVVDRAGHPLLQWYRYLKRDHLIRAFIKDIEDIVVTENKINFRPGQRTGKSYLHFLAMCETDSDKLNPVLDEALKSNDADIDHKDNRGYSPLDYAIFYRNAPAINALFQKGASVSAAQVEELAILQGFDVRLQNPNEFSLLHFAVFWNVNPKFVKQIIQNGADVNLQSKNGTPLDIAFTRLETNPEQIMGIIVLVNAGAEFDLKTRMEAGQLSSVFKHLASALKDKALEVSGVEWKQFIHKITDGGAQLRNVYLFQTPISLAAEYLESTPVLEYMKELDGKYKNQITDWLGREDTAIDVVDKYGRTPLHWAALYRNEAAIKRLIKKGAKVNVKDNDGNLPLHLAGNRGHEELSEEALRLLCGDDVAIFDVKNGKDIIPVKWATMNEHDQTYNDLGRLKINFEPSKNNSGQNPETKPKKKPDADKKKKDDSKKDDKKNDGTKGDKKGDTKDESKKDPKDDPGTPSTAFDFESEEYYTKFLKPKILDALDKEPEKYDGELKAALEGIKKKVTDKVDDFVKSNKTKQETADVALPKLNQDLVDLLNNELKTNDTIKSDPSGAWAFVKGLVGALLTLAGCFIPLAFEGFRTRFFGSDAKHDLASMRRGLEAEQKQLDVTVKVAG